MNTIKYLENLREKLLKDIRENPHLYPTVKDIVSKINEVIEKNYPIFIAIMGLGWLIYLCFKAPEYLVNVGYNLNIE